MTSANHVIWISKHTQNKQNVRHTVAEIFQYHTMMMMMMMMIVAVFAFRWRRYWHSSRHWTKKKNTHTQHTVTQHSHVPIIFNIKTAKAKYETHSNKQTKTQTRVLLVLMFTTFYYADSKPQAFAFHFFNPHTYTHTFHHLPSSSYSILSLGNVHRRNPPTGRLFNPRRRWM